MPSPERFADVKRRFAAYGVATVKTARGGSHWKLVKPTTRGDIIYPIPVHHKKVDARYVRKARRVFGLTNDDGVCDKEFYSK